METPIHQLNENLNGNSFFIKREDLIPFSFGGNKVRKAKLFFKELEKKNCDCVVTYGSSSSNHCRVIANMAVMKNIPCYIISAIGTIKETSNSSMMNLFGAEIICCSVEKVKETIEITLNRLNSSGLNPYFIPGGGHGDLGTQAYVETYHEILKYEKRNTLCFDYIFHTSGTGTTQAGLICGHLLNGDSKKIIGISNARKNPYGKEVILDSIKSFLENINEEYPEDERVYFIDDYVLHGYGTYNKAILKTIKEVMNKEGIPLDTTYTGKAYWGMKNYIKENRIKNKNILFIHTGGTPLYFNDLEELMNE